MASPLASEGRSTPDLILPVPEIRDFERINTEVLQGLNHGAKHIVLMGVEGQRLLAFRLTGTWCALIEIQGNAGPELAAEMDAPGLKVVCHGNTAEGAGRSLKAGLIVIEGSTTEGLGYCQVGGTILVLGTAGNRAGLGQFGGNLIVMGGVERLAGERQRGGNLVLPRDRIGPYFGRGRFGGRSLFFPITEESPDDSRILAAILQVCPEWLAEDAFRTA